MTKLQLTLLKHLATGATLEEIAKKLNISHIQSKPEQNSYIKNSGSTTERI